MAASETFQNIETCNPSTCISGKVMRLSRLTANVFRKYLSPFNITDSQLSILFLLAKLGGLTQKRLSDITKLEKSSLNRNLKRLVDNHYLSREEFPIIHITTKGKRLVNNVVPEWEKAMAEIRSLLKADGENALDLVMHKLSKKN